MKTIQYYKVKIQIHKTMLQSLVDLQNNELDEEIKEIITNQITVICDMIEHYKELIKYPDRI